VEIDPQPTTANFQTELQQMRDMGFYDEAANLRGRYTRF